MDRASVAAPSGAPGRNHISSVDNISEKKNDVNHSEEAEQTARALPGENVRNETAMTSNGESIIA